jgi:hypothetical protein
MHMRHKLFRLIRENKTMNREAIKGTTLSCKTLLLVLLIGLQVACGGGGGGGSQPPPPSSATLSYPSGTQAFVVGTSGNAVTPTITGTLGNFTVSPALPAGIALDPSKGTVYGTPTAITPAATYTISAVSPSNTTVTASLILAITDVPPSNISYGASSLTFSTSVAGSVTPKAAGGAALGWSITPDLPAGLTFNTTDGSISGTPSGASPSATYMVAAQNSGGHSTLNLKILIDGPPLIHIGHQAGIIMVRANAGRVLSEDYLGRWVLWDYAGASTVASGASACTVNDTGTCSLGPTLDLAGSIAVMSTPTGLEVRSAADGHLVSSVTAAANWWKLATDGSYIAAGSTTSLSVWSPSGQLLFSRPGNYSRAMAFASPGAVLIVLGPAGQNVVETVSVPGGTATTGPQFNGQFRSWFADGSSFITSADTTVLVYSNGGAQQGTIAQVPATAPVGGQGNWVWTYTGGTFSVYPATGANPAPAAAYPIAVNSTPYASGATVGLLGVYTNAVTVIDLSGSAPTRTDYTPPLPASFGLPWSSNTSAGPYAAVSASQWLGGNGDGVLLDGASLAGTVRYFGFGSIRSIAGGTGHFAIATALGTVLYFNSDTLAQEGQISFPANLLTLSTDGSLLVAEAGGWRLEVYTLPAGALQYTWPYTPTSGTGVQDITLSGSGTVLGQVLFNNPGPSSTITMEASSPTGGSSIFSTTFSSSGNPSPFMRISPDGTLLAASQSGSPILARTLGATTLYHNDTLVTAFTGVPAGWLDNNRLLVNNYEHFTSQGLVRYASCTIYGADGSPTSAACAVPREVLQLQTVTADSIYVPITNQILSVSTGTINWTSGNPFPHLPAALAGSRVVFVSGTDLLAQSY